VKALVISPDPALRHQLRTAIRGLARRTAQPWTVSEAADGREGLRVAWRELPDLVVADEIASGAGAFAVARDLKGAAVPFAGAVILVLARAQDEWLAKWSGADAWLTKPVDPFALADAAGDLLERQRKEPV
jgi:DNA-binding response OmpR family regulator